MHSYESHITKQLKELAMLAYADAYASRLFSTKLLIEPLSPRELTVIRMLAKGLKPEDISVILGSSMSTIRTHIRNIHCKLDVTCSLQAISVARRLGILGELPVGEAS
jgi:LuxR family transcriptional regulator, maltose regulon positive regulatory protein